MKTSKEIADELNREEQLPSLVRTWPFKMFCLAILALASVIILILICVCVRWGTNKQI